MFARIALAAACLAGLACFAAPAIAEDARDPFPPPQHWSFAGPFGKYDPAQLQRGYQVYKTVCSNCHSARLMSFRNLSQPGGPGYSESQVKALAATFKVSDGPDDSGNMFDRPGRPSDPFPSPFANEQAARAANGGALPPDMSVLAKARDIEWGFPYFIFAPVTQYQEGGVDYIHALLNGYKDAPQGVTVPDGKYYNLYFPGHTISMPPPLSDGLVDYSDDSPKTVDQYAKDVAAYLMWMAEPKLDQRKQLGFVSVVFLAVFAVLLWRVKKRIWAGLKDSGGAAGASLAPTTSPRPRA